MKLKTDLLLERVFLKRMLRKWKLVSIILATFFLLYILSDSDYIHNRSPHIARINIEGFIREDLERNDIIASIADNDSVKAVIAYINSPGGTVVGGETLYNSLKKLSTEKPLVAVLGGQATSAAYMTAIAAPYIIAHEGTVTGSVGVLVQSLEVTEFAKKMGVNPIIYKSKPLKAVPNPFEKITEHGEEALQGLINDIDRMFLSLVKQNRKKLSKSQLSQIATAKAFTGRQALDIGLIDNIGDEDQAVEWFLDNKHLEKELDIIEHELSAKKEGFLDNIFSYINIKPASFFGLNEPLLAVWNPILIK